MRFITLTYTSEKRAIEYFINCDKIYSIVKIGDFTWVNLGESESQFQVDQTPHEILELIYHETFGGNK